MKLGFIGAGNMGGAILKGILAGGKIAANDIFIRNSSDKSTEEVARKNGIQACSSLKEVVTKSDIIFIGVKPYLVANVLQEIKEELEKYLPASRIPEIIHMDDFNDYVMAGQERLLKEYIEAHK